jgi:hypothetical protein
VSLSKGNLTCKADDADGTARDEEEHVERRPGGLGRLRVQAGEVRLEVLDDDGRHVEVSVPVDHARTHALHHLHALHAAQGCRALERRPGVDLLLAALAAADGRLSALVVDAGPPPRFSVVIEGGRGRREVPIDVVDAAHLIFSRRVRLEVRGEHLDWDLELRELLDG